MPKVSQSHIDARRQQILEAAVRCFNRSGFHQTTIDDICTEAGLSPGAVYGYFSGKDEIIRASVREILDSDLLRLLEDAIERFDDFRNLMSMISAVYLEHLQNPAMEEVLRMRLTSWAEALHDSVVKNEVVNRWAHHREISEGIVRRAQKLGQINPALDPGDVARVFQAIEDGLTLMWVVDPSFDRSKVNEVVASLEGGTFWTGKSVSSGDGGRLQA